MDKSFHVSDIEMLQSRLTEDIEKTLCVRRFEFVATTACITVDSSSSLCERFKWLRLYSLEECPASVRNFIASLWLCLSFHGQEVIRRMSCVVIFVPRILVKNCFPCQGNPQACRKIPSMPILCICDTSHGFTHRTSNKSLFGCTPPLQYMIASMHSLPFSAQANA